MSANFFRAVVRHLRERPPTGGDPSADGELLGRFVRSRDADAFEALVWRHGPMVWGVCRRAVRNHADAEDAFQVTFAVLAARAGSVRQPDAIGCWLYGVAHRVARRVRASSARHTANAVADLAPSADERLAAPEFSTVLDEELARLPAKYREPLVLCYLQERTQDATARQLRVSLSTLKRRLDVGRQLLRSRLERRGVDLTAVLALAVVAGGTPAGLATATVAVVLKDKVSGPIGILTREVLFAMWTTKLRTGVAGLVVTGGLLTGVVGHYAATVTGQSAALPTAAKVLPPTTSPNPALPSSNLSDQTHQAQTRVKLAQLDLDLAEVRVSEAQKQFEIMRAAHAAARAKPTEVTAAEANLKRSLIEVQKAKVILETEGETLNRLERSTPLAPLPGATSGNLAVLSSDLRRLHEEQLRAAEETFALVQRRKVAGTATGEDILDLLRWSERIRDARSALDPTARMKAAADHLEQAREVEKYFQERVRIGRDRPEQASAASYFRLNAEIVARQAEAR